MLVETIQLDEINPQVTLTTYVLTDSKDLLNGKKRPAMLICPGGAYLHCTDRESEPVALRFAAMGYHAFVLRYNVYSEATDSFEDIFGGKKLEVRPRTVYPAPIHDIAKAMTYINDHSGEWVVDTEKIGLCGFSAGGHNVLNFSVKYDKPIITDVFDAEKVKPALVIAGYPISDYVFMNQYLHEKDPGGLGVFKISNLSLFGEELPNEDKLTDMSPSCQVTSSTPPMFLWGTAGDKTVPIQHSTMMATALAAKGIPFELHIYEEGDHGLALATQATSQSREELNEIASDWINAAEIWLEKRFSLPLPDKRGFGDE